MILKGAGGPTSGSSILPPKSANLNSIFRLLGHDTELTNWIFLDVSALTVRCDRCYLSDRMSRWEIQLTQRRPWLTTLSISIDRVPCHCPPSLPALSLRFSPRWLTRTSPRSQSLCRGRLPWTWGCTRLWDARLGRSTRTPWRACSRSSGARMTRKLPWNQRIYGMNFTKWELRWLSQNQEGKEMLPNMSAGYG